MQPKIIAAIILRRDLGFYTPEEAFRQMCIEFFDGIRPPELFVQFATPWMRRIIKPKPGQ